jgi:hypothetical protein
MKYAPLDSSYPGFVAMPVDDCAEKLTKKLDSKYVTGYTKDFYYNSLDTSGNQFNYVENSDIFVIADAANCPITSCTI